MKLTLRVPLLVALAWTFMVLSPCAVSPAHAILNSLELHLNSSIVQIVHNPNPNTDVLNLSINVESDGEAGSCAGGTEDLLESGVRIAVSQLSCPQIALFLDPGFDYVVSPYVEHDIGSASYGTFFGLNGPGTVSSKIVALATPPNTCGTWSINLQATGLDLSSITSSPVTLILFDSDASGPSCFPVSANIGTGIAKPHHGVHRARH